MAVEETLTALLNPLVGNRVYWDATPDGGVDVPDGGIIIVQQVGGDADWYVEGAMPSHKNARIQVVCYAKRRVAAGALARLVEKTLCESTLIAQPFGAFQSNFEPDLKIYETLQQFGVWYPDP